MNKIGITLLFLSTSFFAMSQDKNIMRIARITVDSLQLKEYRSLLKEQMDAAIKKEPGVISYTVYEDKSDPTKITIFETYAVNDAYLAHRESPHFKKYKEATKDMVKALDLSEVSLVLSAKKPGSQ